MDLSENCHFWPRHIYACLWKKNLTIVNCFSASLWSNIPDFEIFHSILTTSPMLRGRKQIDPNKLSLSTFKNIFHTVAPNLFCFHTNISKMWMRFLKSALFYLENLLLILSYTLQYLRLQEMLPGSVCEPTSMRRKNVS